MSFRKLSLNRYYSRVRSPKDNAVCERFNRTLKEEFIQFHREGWFATNSSCDHDELLKKLQ
ncbi:integrase core domain-containing protein [Desulfonauticus submarinus]